MNIKNAFSKTEHNNTAVKVSHVSKFFFLPHQKRDTLVEILTHPRKSLSKDRLNILRDINLDIKKGEFFGIIGNNGSGKSTLLKVIAGIYKPNGGKVEIKGHMVPFLELGVGFNPELTARENIFLNGIILGMNRTYLKEKFDEIVQFAELEKFLDLPLKNFSSGMQVRLAFSVAIMSNADIYILDEVLAVGDVNFQEKCFDLFTNLKNQGKTIIFVSHSLGLVQQFCTRAILIDDGRIASEGKPKNVIKAYEKLNSERQQA